jgi:sugar (pentulose or hexulose) kinase
MAAASRAATTSGSHTSGHVITGFLGIDIGTQGLTVLLTDCDSLHVVAQGDAAYGFVPEQPPGCYEQVTTDWKAALHAALQQLRHNLGKAIRRHEHAHSDGDDSLLRIHVLSIGIAGQMHGEVMLDEADQVLNPVRLWCDGRNAGEASELTSALDTKCPQRMTAVRFLWTARHQAARAAQCAKLTTPAGWLAFTLTGQHVLGVGDAAGMFPVVLAANGLPTYDATKFAAYNEILHGSSTTTATSPSPQRRAGQQIQDLLPQIRVAGQDSGCVTAAGAQLLAGLGLADTLVGVPVAAAEGDQVGALAGSLIGRAGTVACSFGTSVCANVVANTQSFRGVSPAVDHFCAADGQPIHMVWLRNGTTFLNSMVQSYRHETEHEKESALFGRLMPALLRAAPDCGGLLALPFMDDEPGLLVETGPSTACLLGWTAQNATPGNVCKAALLATIFNLKAGVQVLVDQGVAHLDEIVLSGGLTKTPGTGQIVADVFACPVRLLAAADEGSSWGAAVLAAYRYQCQQQQMNSSSSSGSSNTQSWPDFLQEHATHRPASESFTPQPEAVQAYAKVYSKSQRLRALESVLRDLQRDDLT